MQKVKFGSLLRLSVFLLLVFILTSTARSQRKPISLKSAEVQSDNSIIFRFKSPDANSVQLNGTWPSEYEYLILMIKKDSIWEVKIGPLPSNMYEYEFVVNGIPTLEPTTSIATRDGGYI